jgi:hypothetical protein
MALQGVEGQPVCMVCLDKEDPYHHFVCSVDGCGGTPFYMAVMERGDNSSTLLCLRHLEEAEDTVMSFMGVPSWLTELDNFHMNDVDLELELEVEWEPDEEPMSALVEGLPDPPRRARP